MIKKNEISDKAFQRLAVINVIFAISWSIFFYFNISSYEFSEAIDNPGTILILCLMAFGMSTIFLPFVNLYFWHVENFKFPSKSFYNIVLSLTPWILLTIYSLIEYVFITANKNNF